MPEAVDEIRARNPRSLVALAELLTTSDFVTLHVHLTPDNPGLLGRAEFAQMKRGCVFVNTSRGELIDEAALLDGLQSGRIGATGLDVLTGEPDVADGERLPSLVIP